MARKKKSSEIAASTSPSGGVVVAGVKLDDAERKARMHTFSKRCAKGKVERKARIRAFADRCEQGKKGLDFPWELADEKTRKKYRQPGQPPAFSSAAEFYEGILAYFEKCDAHMTPIVVKSRTEGAKVVDLPDPKPKHVTELCTFLGIARQTFYNYLKDDHPFHVVADWFEQVSEESWNEQLLHPKRFKAAQFILQAKHRYVVRKDIVSDGKPLGSPLSTLLDEIDGSGFDLGGGSGG